MSHRIKAHQGYLRVVASEAQKLKEKKNFGHKRVTFQCILAILVTGETIVRLLEIFRGNINLFREMALNMAFIFT